MKDTAEAFDDVHNEINIMNAVINHEGNDFDNDMVDLHMVRLQDAIFALKDIVVPDEVAV